MDDTVPPGSPPFTGEEPYTGHIVYDFGKTVTLDRAKLFPRAGTQGLGPKGVTFFAFADDDPTHVQGAIDDVEGDPNLVEIWSGQLMGLNYGQADGILFGKTYTGRYIGMRVDDSYEHRFAWPVNTFQIGEIAFLASNQPPRQPGDANLDGKVDEVDASILAAHWQMTGTAAWGDGDFNEDGSVNDLDASILAANWHSGTGGSAVPEPAAWVLMSCLAMATALRTAHAGRGRAAR